MLELFTCKRTVIITTIVMTILAINYTRKSMYGFVAKVNNNINLFLYLNKNAALV